MNTLPLIICLLFLSKFTLAQDFALRQLEDSPRHHEWVDVKYGKRVVHCFVTYPEISEKTIAIIVIHENRGLTDWVRSVTDQLAAEGYLAIAPDLLSGFDGHAQTSEFANSDDARTAIYQLDAAQVTNDLNAVQLYAKNIPACNGKTAVIGFCWGGTQSFRFATNNNDILTALVFYGSAPEEQADIDRINAPVYGFYGGNDERINSGIEKTEEMMNTGGKKYDYEIYEGAGHAFMRRGEDPAEAESPNKTARDQSWSRLMKILKGL